MAVEEGFVDRHILNGAQTHTRFNLGDSIDKQEGVPVGAGSLGFCEYQFLLP